MASERVHPDVMLILWIPDTDVPGHAFCEAKAREVPKGSGSMDQDVLAVFTEGTESGDSCAAWLTAVIGCAIDSRRG